MKNKEIREKTWSMASEILENVTKVGAVNVLIDGKFNTMAISWMQIGQLWNKPVVTVYVREHRHTHLGLNDSFTISTKNISNEQMAVIGTRSGRDVNKAELLSLSLVEGQTQGVPSIKEWPLTIECKILHKQLFDFEQMNNDKEIMLHYPHADNDGLLDNGLNDKHTQIIAEITAIYKHKK